MVHFQQQNHVQTEYMNFPCDARSSPLSSSMGAFLHKTHYWLTFPGGGTSLQQSEGRGAKQSCQRAISSAVRAGSTKKKSALKYCSLFLNSHLGVSVCRRVKERSARCELSSSSQQSSATAPTISKAGNIISQDLERLYKKVTIHFDNFPGNFRETNLLPLNVSTT